MDSLPFEFHGLGLFKIYMIYTTSANGKDKYQILEGLHIVFLGLLSFSFLFCMDLLCFKPLEFLMPSLSQFQFSYQGQHNELRMLSYYNQSIDNSFSYIFGFQPIPIFPYSFVWKSSSMQSKGLYLTSSTPEVEHQNRTYKDLNPNIIALCLRS